MLTNLELRRRIRELNQRLGSKEIPRPAVVNDVFPQGFNYSIAEEPILRKFGSYFPIRNWSFSIFASCIRVTDFRDLVKQGEKYHLSLIEMADLGGIHLLERRADLSPAKKHSIKTTYDFLVDQLEVDPETIYVSYFSGGSLSRLTKGQAPRDKTLPRDEETYQAWKDLGSADHQLIGSDEDDTFVLTFLPRDFYGGHRSELSINLGTKLKPKLLEIGTFQFLDYRTQVDARGNFQDLLPMDSAIAGSVVGLERTLAAINKFDSLFRCDHISPVVEAISRDRSRGEEKDILILTDAIRTAQIILSDRNNLVGNKNEKRRGNLRRIFLKTIQEMSRRLGIDLPAQLPKYLRINAQCQPWLNLEIDRPVEVIGKYQFGGATRAD